MKNVVAVVLGGGRGSRLQPLTTHRSKPAVPLGGKYRLIDIPLSNCINSGCKQIYVLTQFLSVSLHSHIRGTYRFDSFSGGFVEILAAQQTLDAHESRDWYQGTADAVRKNLRYFVRQHVDYVLILSGDQLYRMDFNRMFATHKASGADITIAAKPVDRHEASGLGIMKVDNSGRVTGFVEKPTRDEQLDEVAMDPSWIDSQGVASNGRDCLASMGIYLFSADVLIDALDSTDEDFGKQVIPNALGKRPVQVHLFDGYWEDIGTIKSFYEANISLCRPGAPFELASLTSPLYTRPRFLPPTRVDGATIKQSLVADGCEIHPGAVIENSIIGLRCRIGPDVVIRDSFIMGADYYEASEQEAQAHAAGLPSMGIGPGARIEGAIVDKNCRIGAGAEVVNPRSIEDRVFTHEVEIRDGVLVVPKDVVVPGGWRPVS